MKHQSAVLFWNNVKVPGYINFEDVIFFQYFFQELNSKEIIGDILEIGAYFGKTSILMNNLSNDSDTSYICDVFEEYNTISDLKNKDEAQYYVTHLPTRAKFERNWYSYCRSRPIILQMESKFLKKELVDGSLKFIHIDGAHTFQAVNQDIEISLTKICKDGIIVMDDYKAIPDVQQVFQSVLYQKKLKLILLTNAKAYFTNGNSDSYVYNLEKFMMENEMHYSKETLNGELFLKNIDKIRPEMLFSIGKILPIKLYKLIRLSRGICIKFLLNLNRK